MAYNKEIGCHTRNGCFQPTKFYCTKYDRSRRLCLNILKSKNTVPSYEFVSFLVSRISISHLVFQKFHCPFLVTKKNEKVIDRLKPFGANFFMDPVTKRVYASTYKRQALFGPDEPFRNFLIPHFANRSRVLHMEWLFLANDVIL